MSQKTTDSFVLDIRTNLTAIKLNKFLPVNMNIWKVHISS